MRIVLCDDNRLLCEALADNLRARGHLVEVAFTSEAGVALVDEYRPDICVLDLRFPDRPDGIAAAAAIKNKQPGTKILILSGTDETAAWAQALEIGVDGFLRKDRNVSHIADALDVIADGGVVFDPTVSRRQAAPPAERRNDARDLLTPREQEVLNRIVAGQTTQQMATEMNVATSTLRSYIKNVLSKLGAHSRLQAAAIASRGYQARRPESAPPGSRPG
jgi:two-component system, NarL family, nitrate/nitrite response regulator NarL